MLLILTRSQSFKRKPIMWYVAGHKCRVPAEGYFHGRAVHLLTCKVWGLSLHSTSWANYNLVWWGLFTHTHFPEYNLEWCGDKQRKASRSHSSHISVSEWNLPLRQTTGNKHIHTLAHICSVQTFILIYLPCSSTYFLSKLTHLCLFHCQQFHLLHKRTSSAQTVVCFCQLLLLELQ